jgi:hypothetical protein
LIERDRPAVFAKVSVVTGGGDEELDDDVDAVLRGLFERDWACSSPDNRFVAP